MWDPTAPLATFLDWWTNRQQRWERASISGPLRPWFAAITIPVVLIATFVDNDPYTLIGGIATLVVAGAAGAGLAGGVRGRLAYRRGWDEARQAMFDSMDEAAGRGMTYPQWRVSEYERGVMDVRSRYFRPGKPPKVKPPPPPDGSHEDIP
jgi:hypothetical protein